MKSLNGLLNRQSRACNVVWIGGWLGAMAQSDDVAPELSPIASDLETAGYLGQRVAEVATRFNAKH